MFFVLAMDSAIAGKVYTDAKRLAVDIEIIYKAIDGYCDVDYVGVVERAKRGDDQQLIEETLDTIEEDVGEGYSFDMLVALEGGCLTSEVEKRVRKSDCVVSVNEGYNIECDYPTLNVKTRQGVFLTYRVERNRKEDWK